MKHLGEQLIFLLTCYQLLLGLYMFPPLLSIHAFTLDCLILTMILYLVPSRLGLSILLLWTQYIFSCHLNYYFHYITLLVKITEHRLLNYKCDTQCLLSVFIRVINFLSSSLPLCMSMTWPHCQNSPLLAKIANKISIITASLGFPTWIQNLFRSTQVKVISPIHLFSTQFVYPTKPLLALFTALRVKDWDLHVLSSPAFLHYIVYFPRSELNFYNFETLFH